MLHPELRENIISGLKIAQKGFFMEKIFFMFLFAPLMRQNLTVDQS